MRFSTLTFPIILLCGLAGPVLALDPGYFPRNAYQERFCAGLDTHFRATNAARVDCTDGTHAIVVEYQDFWPEAVGTAMAFATETGLAPAIVMVCRNDGQHCINAAAGIEATFAHFDLPLTLWQCLPIDVSLADCVKSECKGAACR